jgi:hypothetical protein
MPIKKVDNDKATFSVVVCSDLAISGKPGKYISIEKGASAVSDPSISIRKT